MKSVVRFAVLLWLAGCFLCGQAKAVHIPDELREQYPQIAEMAEDGTWSEGMAALVRESVKDGKTRLFSGAGQILLLTVGVLLLGSINAAAVDKGGAVQRSTDLVGALWVTALSAARLDSMIGLGRATVGEVSRFTALLIPVMASAAAVGGGIRGASLRQVATVFFSDILVKIVDTLLIPMVYLYIALAAAQAVVEEEFFGMLAKMFRKMTVWILSGLLALFTAYLTVGGAVVGSVDAAALRAAKTAVKASVPLVGSILAEASESVLAGAGAVQGTVGIFGILVIAAVTLPPVLRLGTEYLLYRLAGCVAAISGPRPIARLLGMLGDAFAMILAMTAAADMVLVISVLSTLTAVTP